MNDKVTVSTLRKYKSEGKKITALTAYDFPTAKILDECGVNMILVGDSLGMAVLGYESTIPVTMDDMVHHTKAVTKAATRAFIIADMPFMSYNISKEDALKNAARLMAEGGAQSVKLEGGIEVADTVKSIVNAGIPVVGHLGLTPQSVNQLGGYKVQGKDDKKASKLKSDAKSLEDAGICALVLECIPMDLAKEITESISVPTIGIGAGPYCDGQILVLHDMLGLTQGHKPKFVKQYANINQIIKDAVGSYISDVQNQSFPTEEYSFTNRKSDEK
ncbi:3-methyl-2-oxobutanoate hydroxymethyltransferase [Thermoanaerobacterium thermosaccharolyticum]|uniref:3-methyl-2-oxobutanoate hydroxymethyltransferase n=1 Tax=Thermoanaerobacterium thermosaccharolyticum TaxID=1517 RepID=UPI000C070997|nr:3-methyl-2-oxobutanoate hydroxymethyltransferase [Thermoanaerobacterium thermosaccharolyticum]PHO07930.1 3-methyl-2-oxobutanoate hydroxymethyltransferase [Thermoanaerobacterium thermosaccharolyticum]